MNRLFDKTKRRRYFEGWYFKQQNSQSSLAFIPAFHVNDAKEASASLQVVTDTQAYTLDFPAHAFHIDRKKARIRLGKSVFSPGGCTLQAASKTCSVSGSLRFGPLSPPGYDIMGPFSLIPFMECRHSVFSLFHRVSGLVRVNGTPFCFKEHSGYMEGDRGTSFPKRYVWTQCSFGGNSIMLSVAEIPFGLFSFTGCIGFIFLNGREHRIATYCGAKLLHVSNDTVLLRQGGLVLKVKMLHANGRLLRAPHQGSMSRTIHESVACPVQYTCMQDGRILFDFINERASFENNWETPKNP
ncbi:MAG: hypothetical protein ACOYJC_04590 [Christensenellales bacterium]|jgi:hypothetical protein